MGSTYKTHFIVKQLGALISAQLVLTIDTGHITLTCQ